MKNIKLSLATLVVLASGCAPTKSAWLQNPPDKVNVLDANLGDIEFDPLSRVDFLFVVDHSLSMGHHQQNLATNIAQFADALTASKLLDVHFAVTSIFDRQNYGKVDPDALPSNGTLWPIQSAFDTSSQPTSPRYFVDSQTPGFKDDLKKTIMIGERKGPEFEESFSPVIGAFWNETPNHPIADKGYPMADPSKNTSFYRQNAYLVIVFLTDANDDSAFSSEELSQYLTALKGDVNKIIVFSVLAIPPPAGGACKTDLAGSPLKILDFTRQMKGQTLSLCDANFGKKLSEFGKYVKEKTLNLTFQLPGGRPEIKTLTVSYGSRTLCNGADPQIWSTPCATGVASDWTYDSKSNSITLSDRLDIAADPSAKLRVRFTPVTAKSFRDGRAKKIGFETPPK